MRNLDNRHVHNHVTMGMKVIDLRPTPAMLHAMKSRPTAEHFHLYLQFVSLFAQKRHIIIMIISILSAETAMMMIHQS